MSADILKLGIPPRFRLHNGGFGLRHEFATPYTLNR